MHSRRRRVTEFQVFLEWERFYRNLVTKCQVSTNADPQSFVPSLGDIKILAMLIKNCVKLPSRWQILNMMPKWWNLIRVWGTMGWHPSFLNYVRDISRTLHKVYIESIDNGRLPLYLTQGLITPNPKAQKDILLLDNWRPISLLNNDYKIIAVCLVKKWKGTLHGIIDDSQFGFRTGRHLQLTWGWRLMI